ncbi:MAG: hypothetical protein C0399_04800 [Syntrophus sp. (in: bacteria)]|nr:hypothetical protein [Syntrophus sp. (in: bacteria)]
MNESPKGHVADYFRVRFGDILCILLFENFFICNAQNLDLLSGELDYAGYIETVLRDRNKYRSA